MGPDSYGGAAVTKWEYAVHLYSTATAEGDESDITREMNGMGDEGWEMAGSRQSDTKNMVWVIYKRPLKVEETR